MKPAILLTLIALALTLTACGPNTPLSSEPPSAMAPASQQAAQPPSAAPAPPTPAAASLPAAPEWDEEERRTRFLEFFEDAGFEEFLSQPQDAQTSNYFYQDQYLIASWFLVKSSERRGEEVHHNSQGVAYFPLSMFKEVSEAIFGKSGGYTASPLEETEGNPDCCCIAACGMGITYSKIREDSIQVTESSAQITVDDYYIEGDEHCMTRTFYFKANVGNERCPYQLLRME